MNRSKSNRPHLHESILLRPASSAAEAQVVSWQEFRLRYAAVIEEFAQEIGVPLEDIAFLPILVFEALRTASGHAQSLRPEPFRLTLRTCTLHTIRQRLDAREQKLTWEWDELVREFSAVEQIWDEIWEQHLAGRALSALREQISDETAFRAFWKHVILGENLNSVASALGCSPRLVADSSQRLHRLLEHHLRQMRRTEG